MALCARTASLPETSVSGATRVSSRNAKLKTKAPQTPVSDVVDIVIPARSRRDNSSEKRLARMLLLLTHFGKEGKHDVAVPKISKSVKKL